MGEEQTSSSSYSSDEVMDKNRFVMVIQELLS